MLPYPVRTLDVSIVHFFNDVNVNTKVYLTVCLSVCHTNSIILLKKKHKYSLLLWSEWGLGGFYIVFKICHIVVNTWKNESFTFISSYYSELHELNMYRSLKVDYICKLQVIKL